MTSWSGFVAARARASWGLLVTLLALVTVTSAIIAGNMANRERYVRLDARSVHPRSVY